jgi:primosomal protein N' (replication factor Y)
MHYVEVLVGEASYHGSEPLTYSSPATLGSGRLVMVPLRHKQVLGVVVRAHSKRPSFPVKPVTEIPDLPPLPASLVELLHWIIAYYPAPLGILTQLFLPSQLPKRPEPVSPVPPPPVVSLPHLTKDQTQALAVISGPGLHLLHGETGTGKTRVYVELAKRSLASGKSVIVLTPEIGLTSQLANDFRAVFGKRVFVAHSQLTDAVRQRTWQYILEQTEPLIIIGARSALFSPLSSVGLIVVDEAHETAYKQDQAPYYHATTVAAKLAGLHQATLVLGSATPLVSDYYIASAKERPIVRMATPATSTALTEINTEVIDLKKRDNFSRSPYLSNELLGAVQQTLESGEQALLFLNRRGTARVVFCESCGWQASCPHCDLPLVYHGDSHLMRCHTCDFKASSPTSCPVCRSASIVFKSIGTKAIAAEIERLFREANIMRFDTDNKKSERIEQHYDAVRAGKVDILIGTQTLAKGLDLPKLSLVGVIIADTGLYFPDFSAQERTYQLLSQVLGRIGRGHRAGQAVIQTYNPESIVLQAVLKKDWSSFYNSELEERRLFNFPPFCYLLKLTCKRASSTAAQRVADQLAKDLRQRIRGVMIDGPAPSFHEKVQNKFAWQLVVKARQRQKLLEIIASLPAGWSYDIDPMNLL